VNARRAPSRSREGRISDKLQTFMSVSRGARELKLRVGAQNEGNWWEKRLVNVVRDWQSGFDGGDCRKHKNMRFQRGQRIIYGAPNNWVLDIEI
jgi:hypothetical protein